jgi:hypothetical protein
LLLEVKGHARPARILTHGVDIGGLTSGLGERNRIRKVSGATTAQKAGDLDLAGLPPQLVSFLDFPDQLKLVEGRI